MTVTGERLWESCFPRTRAGIAQYLARLGPASRVAVEATGPTWSFDAVQPTGATV